MEELITILKKLEEISRTYQVKAQANNGLAESILAFHINIFFTTYAIAVADFPKDSVQEDGSEAMYFAYLRNKFSPARYLLELYLTIARIMNEMKNGDGIKFSASMWLSEKVNIQKIDTYVDSSLPSAATATKLENNRKEYKNFIAIYGKNWQPALPKELDLLLPPNKKFAAFNLEFIQHGKLNYSQEIDTNPIAIKAVEKEMTATNTVATLHGLYNLVSAYIHPTLTSIKELEQFISKPAPEKSELLNSAKSFNISMLRIVGKGVINLTT